MEKHLDKLYYDELDYLLLCDLYTNISQVEEDITFSYKLKENNLFHNKNELKVLEESGEIDNWYGFIKDKEFSMGYNIYDWICENLDYKEDWEDKLEIVVEMLDSQFDNVDRDCEVVKQFLYSIKFNFNVFYNRIVNEEWYNYICSLVG